MLDLIEQRKAALESIRAELQERLQQLQRILYDMPERRSERLVEYAWPGARLADLLATGQVLEPVTASLYRIAMGLLWAVAIGVPVGAMGGVTEALATAAVRAGADIRILTAQQFLRIILVITTIPLGVAITLNKTSPLFVSVLAFFLLNEHLSRKGVVALLVGFIGVLLITKPVGLELSYEHFLGILGGFFAAAAYTTIKKIKHIYDARVIVLSFMTTGTLFPLFLFVIAPYVPAPEALAFLFVDFKLPDTAKVWTLILLIGVISTLSQWLLTKAYSLSKAGVIGVVSYTNIPFAIGFGYMLGDAFPDFWTFCGIGLIVLGGVLVKKG